MWVSVPLISVVFSVIIYITGFGSRLSETTSNTFSIYSMDSKGYPAVLLMLESILLINQD